MAVCSVCGTEIGFFEGDQIRRCKQCIDRGKWPEGHPKNQGEALGSQVENYPPQEAQVGSIPRSFYTQIAYWVAGITLASSLLVAIIFLGLGQGLFALVVFVGGFLSFAFLGLLAEISSNIGRLLESANKSNPTPVAGNDSEGPV